MNKQQKLEMLLKYAELGLRVHPLRDNGKEPRWKGWKEKATFDPLQIKQWVYTLPDAANWMIATGKTVPGELGVVVWDIDNKPEDPDEGLFKTGFDYLKELLEEKGITEEDIPKTWTVRTPTGGLHYYFRIPEGVTLTKYEGKPKPRMDIRANSALVVAPPSIHPEKKEPYQWVEGHAPWEIPIAPLPDWLLEAILESIKPKRKVIAFGELETAAGLADELNDEDVTWERIYNYPLNQENEPGFSNGWIRFYCPVHGGDNQQSFSVCTDEQYYGYFRCHNCGIRGYIVGTKGWYRWQDYKKRKGLNSSSPYNNHNYPVDYSIPQDFAFDDFDNSFDPEPPSEARERDITWDECLLTYSEIRKANAHLRAFAENFKKRYPDEDDIFEAVLKVETQIERAKRLRSMKMISKWLPEMVSVYASIQMVYDEDVRRMKEEQAQRHNEEWTKFLASFKKHQFHTGLPFEGAISVITKTDGSYTPGMYSDEVLPQKIKELVKSRRRGKLAPEKFAELLQKELDAHLYETYGGYYLTKYEQDGKVYYCVEFHDLY